MASNVQNATKFSLQLDKFLTKVDQVNKQVTETIAIEIYTDIIKLTPVKTGVARGSWRMTRNKVPADFQIGDPKGASDGQFVAAGNAEHAKLIKRIRTGKTFPRTITIRNTVPYIVPLEYGHSSKASDGFLRIALKNARKRIKPIVRAVEKRLGV